MIFTMFQKCFYMFKTLKKACEHVNFFVQEVPFPSKNVHKIVSIFL
jgi:hypothetical protein